MIIFCTIGIKRYYLFDIDTSTNHVEHMDDNTYSPDIEYKPLEVANTAVIEKYEPNNISYSDMYRQTKIERQKTCIDDININEPDFFEKLYKFTGDENIFF